MTPTEYAEVVELLDAIAADLTHKGRPRAAVARIRAARDVIAKEADQ